jgi:CelD/BcsL family acetyltransferase involved in cellulose biosynthesis
MRSYLLWVEDRPIAFQIGFQADGVYYCDQTGYDPEWASYRPGTMMIFRYLLDLYREDKPSVIDFGYGENEYKRFFGNDVFEEATVYLVNKSPRMGLVLGCHWACSRTSTAVRVVLEGLGWKEKVRRRLRGRGDRSPLSPPPETLREGRSPAENTPVGVS